MRNSIRGATAAVALMGMMGISGCEFGGKSPNETIQQIVITAKTVQEAANGVCEAGKAVLGPIELLGVGDHAAVQGAKQACTFWLNLPQIASSRGDGAVDVTRLPPVANPNNDPELAAFLARLKAAQGEAN